MTQLKALIRRLLQLGILGLFVGLLCWQFNLLDRWVISISCRPICCQGGI